MQLGYFIAKKLSFSKQQSFTKTITLLAIAAVSISVCVVIISFGILLGFKNEIRQKVKGYAGDLNITRYQLATGNESNLFENDKELLAKIVAETPVTSAYPFIYKTGILKSDSTLEGINIKGLPANYDFSFYQKHLIKGKIPAYTDSIDSYDILLSEFTSKLLEVDTGDRVNLYFIDTKNVIRRKPKVVGIYNTGLQEFDKLYAISHLRVLQRIVSKDYKVVAGYELQTDAPGQIISAQEQLAQYVDYNFAIKTVMEMYPSIFQWLDIVDTNVIVIIILMLIVAIINIITVLLILIIDRVPMIGVLQALGAPANNLMSIFRWQGLFILIGGLLLGNIIALGLAYVQVNYKVIGLPADTYYMDFVPFVLPASYLVYINIGALLICFIFTYIPVLLIHKIQPTQSINFR